MAPCCYRYYRKRQQAEPKSTPDYKFGARAEVCYDFSSFYLVKRIINYYHLTVKSLATWATIKIVALQYLRLLIYLYLIVILGLGTMVHILSNRFIRRKRPKWFGLSQDDMLEWLTGLPRICLVARTDLKTKMPDALKIKYKSGVKPVM